MVHTRTPHQMILGTRASTDFRSKIGQKRTSSNVRRAEKRTKLPRRLALAHYGTEKTNFDRYRQTGTASVSIGVRLGPPNRHPKGAPLIGVLCWWRSGRRSWSGLRRRRERGLFEHRRGFER